MSKNKEVVTTSDGSMYVVTAKKEVNGIAYNWERVKDYKAAFGERLLSHTFLMDSFRKIMGRTLTVIDASIHEKTQNKAMKDLIRDIFSDEMDFAAEMAYDQMIIQKSIPKEIEEVESVTIEQALGVEE